MLIYFCIIKHLDEITFYNKNGIFKTKKIKINFNKGTRGKTTISTNE